MAECGYRFTYFQLNEPKVGLHYVNERVKGLTMDAVDMNYE